MDEHWQQTWAHIKLTAKVLAMTLLLLGLYEDRGVAHLAAWSFRASAESLDWLRSGNAEHEFIRHVRARAESVTSKLMVELVLSVEHVARGTVSLGSNLPYSWLLARTADIKRLGAGHITVLNIGGSSSTGADLDRLDEIFSAVFGRTLENILGVPVIVLNAAVGATGSDYYAICISQHLSPSVDVVLTENAINDATLLGNNGAAIVQQLIIGVRVIAPRAVFVYSGLFRAHSCTTGEDVPRVLDVYKLYNASIVSTRNLVFGGNPSLWSNSQKCPELKQPFSWEVMFKDKGHPGSKAHEYLAFLISCMFSVHFHVATAPFSMAGLQESRPLFDTFPFSGLGFDCKSTLSPRFGAPLIPVPSPGCKVFWSASGEPELDHVGCSKIHVSQLWEQRVSSTPQFSEVEEFPLVENWELSTASFFEPDKVDQVRQDRKFNWESAREGAAITFYIFVGVGGMVAMGYIEGDEYYGAATFRISNAAGVTYSVDVIDQIKTQRHTRALILFRNLTREWWHLQIEPHGRFGICAIATS